MEEIRTTLKAFEKSLADLSAATRKLADQLDACVSKKHS
jgi:hypothetical protein